jgi:hypothetical protein
MKTQKMIFFSILLLVTMLACATITNLASPTNLAPIKPTPSKVIFEDSEFVDSCNTESTSDVERFVDNGQFMMRVITTSYIGWTECTAAEYADFVIEVDAKQVSGPDNNAYGVIIRYGIEADDFYAFIISGDGYYAFTVDGANHTDPEFLVDWTETSVINKGMQTNRIKISAIGSSMKYYINNQLLGEVQDSRFTTGTIGFIAGTVDEGGVQIAFDNLRISEP